MKCLVVDPKKQNPNLTIHVTVEAERSIKNAADNKHTKVAKKHITPFFFQTHTL